MILILEGPDNSGKSTLAAHLSEALAIPITSSEGPEKYPGEINERLRRYHEDSRKLMIFDRHPAISQLIYGSFREGGAHGVDPDLVQQLYNRDPLIIYCHGRSLSGHVIKDHDSAAHRASVARYHEEICQQYDAWAAEKAHIHYRVGDSMERVLQLVKGVLGPFDPVQDICEFHEKFGLNYQGPPRSLPKDIGDFRQRFLQEELIEYMDHSSEADFEKSAPPEGLDYASYSFHLGEQLDALVDLVYVALGTSYLHGFNFKEAWRRVHEANMRKIRAPSAKDSKRGSTYDVVKPEGWQAPDHSDLVECNDLWGCHESQ